jgi:hypothetical protein
MDNYTKHYLDKRSYRIPLGCLYIVPTLLAVGLFFVPESPRKAPFLPILMSMC